jgi:hypothetical protein
MDEEVGQSTGNVSQNIKYYENKLNKKLGEIGAIKNDVYMDMFYYIIIVGIMCFFVYIILSDLYTVVKLHSVQNQDSKSSQSKYNIFEDNNTYDNDNDNDKNSSMYILQSLNNQDDNINKEFEDLLLFKNENKLDATLYTDASVKSISSDFDDYKYPKRRNESNFFSMLFERPKHASLVNKAGGAFIDF